MTATIKTIEAPASSYRLRKGPVTFKIQLTEEQKRAKALALQSTITILTGKPGTSKSTLACNIALDLLIKGNVAKIIITRPTVEIGKTQGFLPGDAFDFKQGKMAPYIFPILDSMYQLRKKDEIDKMIDAEKIEILPIQFVRGRNFKDCAVIVDESQNATLEEFVALTTRICKDGKIIFTSDLNQVDLLNKNKSCGNFLNKIKDLEGVSIIELTENFRHPLALQIMEALK